MAACSRFDESSYKTPRFGSGRSTSPAASNQGFQSSSCERNSGTSAISAGLRGSLPPLKLGEHAGKNTSSSNSSACSLGKYAGLHAEELLDEVFFPACSPSFNGGKLPRKPADMADVPLLRSHDELWKPWFDAAGLVDLPEPKRGVLYEDSSNLLQADIQGQGIALVRRSLAMHEIVAGRLVRLFNVDGPSPWNYYFVCPHALLGTQRVQVFRTWLFDEIMRFKQLYECTPAACDAPVQPQPLPVAPELRLKAPL